MNCPKCGAENPDTPKFCSECGYDLQSSISNGSGSQQDPSLGNSYSVSPETPVQSQGTQPTVPTMAPGEGVQGQETQQKKAWYARPVFIIPIAIVIVLLLCCGMASCVGLIGGSNSASQQQSTTSDSNATSKDSSKSESTSNKSDSATSSTQTTPSTTTTPSTPAAPSTPPATETVPVEYKNALTKAQQYNDLMFMSKNRLYDQLTSEYGEQFSAEAAQYAIDNVKADWNANALKKAREYQNNMAMSPSAIYDQLVSEYGEDFTEEEAQYAIDNL